MAIERFWEAVGPVLFTANGTADGTITLSSVAGFKVKQSVVISGLSLPDKKLEVKKVLSPTKLVVGPVVTTGKMLAREDLTAYTTAALSSIRAEEQKKSIPTPEDILRAVYRQEPGTTIGVEIDDQFGNPIDSITDEDGVNRLAVDAQVSVVVPPVTVALDALTPNTQANPDNVLVAGSEDGTKGGLKHAFRVDGDLDLRVGISNGNNKAGVNNSGEVSVIDAETRSSLQDILDVLNNGTIAVSDAAAHALLTTIIAGLVSIDAGIPAALGPNTMANSMPVTLASDQPPIEVTGDIVAVLGDEPIKISGTENGQPNGPEFPIVNNLRLQILAAKDREQVITYADFGTKNQRVTQIDYVASSIGTGPGFTARKKFKYTLVVNNYRRDSIEWSLV